MTPFFMASLSVVLCVAHAGPRDKCLLLEDDLVSPVDPLDTVDPLNAVDLGDLEPHQRPEVDPLLRRTSARWPCFDEKLDCAALVAKGLCFPEEEPSLDQVGASIRSVGHDLRAVHFIRQAFGL